MKIKMVKMGSDFGNVKKKQGISKKYIMEIRGKLSFSLKIKYKKQKNNS